MRIAAVVLVFSALFIGFVVPIGGTAFMLVTSQTGWRETLVASPQLFGSLATLFAATLGSFAALLSIYMQRKNVLLQIDEQRRRDKETHQLEERGFTAAFLSEVNAARKLFKWLERIHVLSLSELDAMIEEVSHFEKSSLVKSNPKIFGNLTVEPSLEISSYLNKVSELRVMMVVLKNRKAVSADLAKYEPKIKKVAGDLVAKSERLAAMLHNSSYISREK